MAAKQGKGIVILAAVAVLGALTYVGITLFGGKGDKGGSDGGTGGGTGGGSDGGTGGGSDGGTGGGTGGGGGYIAPVLDQPEDIAGFQKWVFYTKKDKSLVTAKAADGVDGIWGNKSAAAWAKYKTEYLKSLETPTKPAGYKIPQDVQDAILTIVAMGAGSKAKKSYLESGIEKREKRDWVRQWAAALKANKADINKGTTFNWVTNGKDWGLFEAYSGNKILDFNPKGKNPAPLAAAYFYEKPEVSMWSYVQAIQNIGTITGYKFDNKTKKLWLYVAKPYDSVVSDPNIFGTRWILADEVKF